MKHHIIFIDYQNVRPDLKAVVRRTAQVNYVIFLGAGQKKLLKKIETETSGLKAEIMALDQEGKNALDFHIAYYLGVYTKKSPETVFHIISKDKGFAPLISHLRTQGFSCVRSSGLPNFLLRPETAPQNPAAGTQSGTAPHLNTYSTSVSLGPTDHIPFPVWSPVFLPAL